MMRESRSKSVRMMQEAPPWKAALPFVWIKVWTFWAMVIFIVLTPFLAGAEEETIPFKPAPGDKCPVCGMFVAKYPDFVAQIIFKDGSSSFFDGVKDMMKFYFNPPKYNPSKTIAEIDQIRVTDYYSMNPIDGRSAHYVIGSDVYGPMGKELIPLEKEPDAKEFMDDHKGKSILQFGNITREMVSGLD